MGQERKDEKQESGFKVSDRRRRYEPEEGATPDAAKPETAPEPGPAPGPAAGAAAKPEGAPAAPAAPPAGAEAEELPHAGQGAIGPAEFVQLVGKLYEEALVYMGYHDDPRGGQSLRNLPIATWHIDILDVLKARTKGNLSPEEAAFLDEATANLKVHFARASGYLKR